MNHQHLQCKASEVRPEVRTSIQHAVFYLLRIYLEPRLLSCIAVALLAGCAVLLLGCALLPLRLPDVVVVAVAWGRP
jgi:hypothetical protein